MVVLRLYKFVLNEEAFIGIPDSQTHLGDILLLPEPPSVTCTISDTVIILNIWQIKIFNSGKITFETLSYLHKINSTHWNAYSI